MPFLILILLVLFAWGSLALFSLLFANRMIFPAPQASYGLKPPFFSLQSANGDPAIAALWLPAAEAQAPVLLFSHGNGEDLGMILPLLDEFNRRGWAVLAYEYPGYGPLPGTASEQGCYQAAMAAWQHLIGDRGVEPQHIFLYGRSLGGGPSVELATKVNPGGLILDGTFTSTFRVVTHFKLVWWDRFDNLARIPRVACPILIIHGDRDEVVPIWHGQRLFERARADKQKLHVRGAGHNNLIEIAGEAYWDAIDRFQQTHYQLPRV